MWPEVLQCLVLQKFVRRDDTGRLAFTFASLNLSLNKVKARINKIDVSDRNQGESPVQSIKAMSACGGEWTLGSLLRRGDPVRTTRCSYGPILTGRLHTGRRYSKRCDSSMSSRW